MADPVPLDASGDERPPAGSAVAPASLLAAVKATIVPELPRHAARHFGEDEARVRAATDLLILAGLRRLARRSATIDGAAQLFGDLGSRRLDADLSAALDRLLADPPDRRDEQPAPGERTTERHFGRSTESVVRRAASATGLSVETVRRLLVLTTLHVLAGVRDYMRATGLDADGLRQRLASEYPVARWIRWRPLRGALVAVAAVAVALAWRSTDGPGGAPGSAESSRAPRQAGSEGSPASRLPRGTGASAIIGFLSGDAAQAEYVSEKEQGAPAPRGAEPERPPAPQASHSPGVRALIDFLSSDAEQVEHVFVFDRVEFEPGSATLKSSSNAQLKEVAAAVAAFPRTRITVEVHADGDTEEARAMAERRAVAVRAALAVFGVPLARTSHAGVDDTIGTGHRLEARVTKG